MKLKSIYIDGLHNAVAKTYELGDLVYLYGRNGAGKTTVLNAIQLALLGYIPGTAKNSREALLRHSPKGVIIVRLEICDVEGCHENVYVERIIGKNGSKVNMLPSNFDLNSAVKDLELPIFNFNEFVGQTANKLKEYFIKNILVSDDGELDWGRLLQQGITDVSIDDADAIIAYGLGLISHIQGTPLEQVAQANAAFKEELSFNRAELTRLQSTVDSLIYYGDYTGPRDLDALNSKLLSLGAIRDALIRYQSAESIASQHRVELARLRERAEDLGDIEHLNAIYDDYNAEYSALSPAIEELKKTVAEIGMVDHSLSKILDGKGICPYTDSVCSNIDLSDIQNQYDFNRTKYEVRGNELQELITKQKAISVKLDEAAAQISAWKEVHERMDVLQKSLSALPDKPATDKTIQELDTEIQKYTEDKEKLKANQAYEATIEEITREKYLVELHGTILNAWVKLTDTNGLQTTLMEQPFEDLATKMTYYIQTMYGDSTLRAKFNISTKANSFNFGILRGDNYIPYDQLSAGEKCLYTLALMICITDNSKSPLKLILIDNSLDNLDDIAAENTFTALKNINGIQFIMAGVKACKNAEDVIVRL